MAGTEAVLPGGPRLTDHVSLGVLTAQFPLERVEQVLFETERLSARQRDLPAHVMVYYAIALALYADVSTREVLRCLLEGVRWLGDPTAAAAPAGKSGISQARTRLAAAPREALCRAVVAPVATADTPGAMYRTWRVMSLDGTTLDVGDTVANRRAFARPTSTRGANPTGAFPQLRVVGLVETGTHVLRGAQLGAYHTGEVTLAADVVPHLRGDMLCLADRGFLGFDLWRQAAGARPRHALLHPCLARHPPDAPASGGASPPQAWPRAHQAILHELRAERVSSSRGRAVPRGVKRKMSNFPLRPAVDNAPPRAVIAYGSLSEPYWT